MVAHVLTRPKKIIGSLLFVYYILASAATTINIKNARSYFERLEKVETPQMNKK